MRKTDISKYTDENNGSSSVSASTITKRIFSVIGKFLLTGLFVMIITGIVIAVSLLFYIADIANEPLNIDLHKIKLNLTSFIYVQNDNGEWEEYQQLYSSENRVWVDYQDINKNMIKAIVAIEDKRFWDHEGVDWYRTGGAVLSLATGRSEYGGSTITQQLIKNITDDNEVSITRKLREIFRALKLEKEYTKDDIIETYLNVVNFGSGCRGVQAAANLYFNKDIGECTIAECAAIAGITQNPYAYDPLNFPENNKDRRETVIQAMYDQKKINKEEYDQAMKESQNMKFIGYVMEEDDDDISDWNWYIDRLFRDVVNDLQTELNIGIDYAEDKIYKEGLKIYCAMDKNAQEIAERKVREWETPADTSIEVGYMMMDFDGRILATVGGRQEKEGRLLWDNATSSVLQPGSTIKPISSYVLAIEDKKINYSSMIADSPVSNWGYVDGGIVDGPENWYLKYYGNITVNRALNISSNAAAVSVLNMIGMNRSYKFLTENLHFTHLDPEKDSENLAGLSIGGFYSGTTVEEMTAAYQMFGNGGYYYEPYTYYYVTDNEGNVLLDKRDMGKPDRVISEETSTIMNRLLYDVVNSGGEALGYRAKIDGWDIIGKTGTTDASCDNWFVGASPYAVAGIWTGHETSYSIALEEQGKCGYLWRDIMAEWLEGKEHTSFNLSNNVEQHTYCKTTGLLANEYCKDVVTGYYTSDNIPSVCTSHIPASSKPNDESSSEPSDDESSGSEESSEESAETPTEESSEQTSENSEPSQESAGNGESEDISDYSEPDESGRQSSLSDDTGESSE